MAINITKRSKNTHSKSMLNISEKTQKYLFTIVKYCVLTVDNYNEILEN